MRLRLLCDRPANQTMQQPRWKQIVITLTMTKQEVKTKAFGFTWVNIHVGRAKLRWDLYFINNKYKFQTTSFESKHSKPFTKTLVRGSLSWSDLCHCFDLRGWSALSDMIPFLRIVNQLSHCDVQVPQLYPLDCQQISLGHQDTSRTCSPFPW